MAYKWGLLLTNWDDPPSKGLSQETSTNLHECLIFCGFHVGQIYQSHAWYGIHIYIYIHLASGPETVRRLPANSASLAEAEEGTEVRIRLLVPLAGRWKLLGLGPLKGFHYTPEN